MSGHITIPLADAKRLVRLLDAYDLTASHANKWGYSVQAPDTCWDAAARLRRKTRLAAARAAAATDGG